MSEMKPCPYVMVEKEDGHNLDIDYSADLPRVGCSCGARGPVMSGKESAIEAWNTCDKDPTLRTALAEKEEELRRAEEVIRFYANGWNCFSMMHNDLVKDEGDRARNWLAGRGE